MSQHVAQLTLEAALGETRQFSGTHQTSSTDTTPIDITGWTLTVTIKNPIGTTVTLAGTVVSGTAGTYRWTITAANTVTLGVNDSKIDVWRTDVGSETLMGLGTFSITQEVRV